MRPLAGLPKPDRLVVHDFEVTPANAERNWDIVPQILQSPGAADQTKKELSIGATSVKTFVDTLIQELRSRGMGVERASEARPPEINTFSVRGRFLWIRQAHQGMRARVWFYQGTGSNLRLVAESDAVIRRDLQFGSADKGSQPGGGRGRRQAHREGTGRADRRLLSRAGLAYFVTVEGIIAGRRSRP